MANKELLDVLNQGVARWNQWREEHEDSDAQLDLYKADLRGKDLREADLSHANLTEANLTKANLSKALLVEANLTRATLKECSIYGVSAWNVELEGATQESLIITRKNEPTITVDNLKIAQFIYLLLKNKEFRDAIDTIVKKAVLILGRFTPPRKAILDALREELRQHDYLPVVFDFDQPGSRNLTETVSTLAHLSRFIIADLTAARSIPQELERIVPRLRVPVQALLHESEQEAYAMFSDFQDYPWILPLYRYTDQALLLQSLRETIITPAEQKVQELEQRKQGK